MIELDRIDRKLLYEVGINSRQPLAALAKRLHLGSDLVEYRLKRFIEKGYIKKLSVVVDPSALGWTIFKTYLRISGARVKFDKLISELERHPRTYWLAEVAGTWNLVVSMWARDVLDFQRIQDEVLAKFGPLVSAIDVFPLVEVEGYTRRFLVDQRNARYHFSMGSSLTQELDDIDKRLLFGLSIDACKNAVDLAQEIGTTPAIVRYRIEKLQKLGVIRGYRIQIGYDELQLTLFKVIIHRSRYDKESEEKLREFCRGNRNVLGFIRQLGSHTIEIEIEVSSHREFYAFTDQLYAACEREVQDIDSLVLRTDYHHRLPKAVIAPAGKV